MNVYRSEIHIIKKHHELFNYCDDMCFKSKNLYNYANYFMRQEFIKSGKIISAFDLNKQLKTSDPFRALPAKTSQQIILKLGKNWKSFFKGIKDYSKHPSKYCGKPNLPKYKNKNGRNIVFFDYMQGKFKEGKYHFSKSNHFIETKVTKENFVQMQIIPCISHYKITMVYKKEVIKDNKLNNSYLAIDLGIDNLATLTNNIGLQPIVINGRILKSINQYYNKKLAQAMSCVGRRSSNRIKRISLNRDNIVQNYLHHASRYIINYCTNNKISHIVIGNNKDWQRNSNMGKKNNQKFVQIPFTMLIQQLQYKAENIGIDVRIIEEQYTSKASFIDNDEIPVKFAKYDFSGKRVKRGLYKSSNGTLINADVNGSYNILRKCNPEFKHDDRIEGIGLYPIRLNIA